MIKMSKTGKFHLKGGHGLLQRRYMATLLAFLCAMVMQTQRINVSFAIVAMTNTTISSPVLKNRTTSDCETAHTDTESTSIKVPEFNWNPEIQGYILSAGFVGFFFTLMIGGYLSGRYSVKAVLFSSILGASLCTLASPMAARTHPYLLIIVQFIKGMFQGPPAAAFLPLMARWFPIHERGYLATFIYIGFSTGGFTGSLVSGPICEIDFDGGWPLVFYIFGIFGILVSLLLLFLYADSPADDPRISEREKQYILENTRGNTAQKSPPIPWKGMMTSSSTYVFFISLFGQCWMVFYLLTVHPIYMDTILHIPVKENGLLTSGPQLTQAISTFCVCWLSIWLKQRSTMKIILFRKGYNTLGCSLYILGMLGLYLSGCNYTLNEIFLFIIAGSVGFTFAGCLIVAADITPTFCGILMGAGSTFASLSGFILPVLVGHLTKEEQTMHQWHKIFLITSSVVFVSGFVFLMFGTVDIQPYDPAFNKESKMEKKMETPPQEVIKQEITITKF